MTVKKIVLTGSHLTPAVSLQDKLEAKDWRVIYLAPDSAKFNRHQPLISWLSLVKLPGSCWRAWQDLRKTKPQLVVSFGGYAALPVCLAAKLLGLPLIIHEQTFSQGLTNKLTAFLADKVAISWSESQKFFPTEKTVLTGNPLRLEILNINMLNAKRYPLKTIYITGGHQGSLILNQVVSEILPELLTKYKVYHQFGLTQTEALWQKQQKITHKNYWVKRWFSVKELVKIYQNNPLVISRSGINTVTELAWLNLRAILVPLTTAQKNEQLTNACWLESLGLAIVLSQSELSGAFLLKAIDSAFKDLPVSAKISFNRKLVLKATDNLYQIILDLLK